MRSDMLPAGVNYAAITLTVNVASNAPSPVTNPASVSSDGAVNSMNSTASDVTNIVPPILSLTKTADAATVSAGVSIGYTMAVSNSGAGTAIAATLNDPLPAGTGISWSISPSYAGPGSCSIAGVAGSQALGCSFSDLGAGATASMHITSSTSTASCAVYSNTATVSAGNSSSVQSSAATTVFCPSLTIAKTHTGNFTQGQTGAYSVTVSNGASAGSTSGTVTMTETVPSGMTLVSMNGGVTWNCAALPSCTTRSVLNGAASYPPITVTVNVAFNAPLQLTNQVSLSGGGSVPASASDATTIVPAVIGDFDGNGKPDLVWQYTDGSVVVWYLGGADGSSYQSAALLSGPSSGWRIAAVADLNGDGIPDLIWQSSDGSVVVWYMGGANGSTYRSAALLAGPSSGWRIVAVADLNGDGIPDLIWQGSDGSVVVWYMSGANGSAYQSAALLASPSSGWRIAAVADLNGDGIPDLIWQSSDGSVVVWYMGGANGSTYQNSALLAGPSSGWRIAAVADLNADSRPELIWQSNDGSVVAWYMGGANGSTYQSAALLSGPSSGWLVVAM